MSNINDSASLSGPAPVGMAQDPSCLEFTSGAAGGAPSAVASGLGPVRSVVILNGVGTTFALTLPAPLVDGQECHVMFVTAVSVAFSCVIAAPAAAVKGVPSTQAAGTGICFYYHAQDATWYRKW